MTHLRWCQCSGILHSLGRGQNTRYDGNFALKARKIGVLDLERCHGGIKYDESNEYRCERNPERKRIICRHIDPPTYQLELMQECTDLEQSWTGIVRLPGSWA
jgi:hypothetical protein